MLAPGFALPQSVGSSQTKCDIISPSSKPDYHNVVYDTDPNFVYYAENCTSTTQKILPSAGWAIAECTAAIQAVCGTTSVKGGVGGSWTWGWHTTVNSITCQAGLWQDYNAGDKGGVGWLDPSCCKNNFIAVQNELAYKGMFDPLKGNRLSVNIVHGGFPHTEVQYDSGLESGMLNKNGAQITAGYPSYILQAFPCMWLDAETIGATAPQRFDFTMRPEEVWENELFVLED
ncbi:MAG: hypothetical protein Q9223_005557 [Gallowayella weberi]